MLAAVVVSLSLAGGVACTPNDVPNLAGNQSPAPTTAATTAPTTAPVSSTAGPGPTTTPTGTTPTTAPTGTTPPTTSASPTPLGAPPAPSPTADPTVGPRPVTAVQPTGSGRAFFVDSARGDDTANGTSPATAWRSLGMVTAKTGLVGGSTINLARGSSFTGSLVLATAGVTLQPYGSGAAPVISSDGWTAVQVTASNVLVQGIEVHRAKRGVSVEAGASKVTIRDSVAAGTGIGFYVDDSGNLITHNDAHDGVMVRNTQGGGDDYGANGYWAQGPGNEWSYNTGTNLDQPSFDYGRDGGFIEVYAGRQNIHHNQSRNTEGFIEISENGDGTIISNNTITDPNGTLMCTHVLLNGVRIDKNIIVNTKGRGPLLLTNKPVRSGSDVAFTDNDVTSTVPLANAAFSKMTHTGNTYRNMRNIGVPLQTGERSI